MNKTLLSIALLLLAQHSFAGHHEKSEKDMRTIIGYEISDEGEKLDIVAGDISVVDVWVKYVEAHNKRDLEAIDNSNADDFEVENLLTSLTTMFKTISENIPQLICQITLI